ncbi:hypothetical protein [Lacihabitans lacunae]|jgi:hypothetical protein|uniref:Uncharacterized protein n=1 Tax=Lacihabitans lacunae TaxID=1028214 RepID=A0ABV7YVQ4_9BACT
MDNSDKIIEGLEIAYKKLIEFKKYKKTPLIVSRDGKVIEIYPDQITNRKNVYNS